MIKNFEISESALLTDATEQALVGKRYKVRLIEGDKLGSSGYYPADMLKQFGPKVFRKGTPMYLNHQTPAEKADRPFGVVQDFAAELTEDAYYENDGLYAEIEVFEHHIPMIRGLKDKIGVSIRAKGTRADQPLNINGKLVPVFTSLTSASSVDFVVKAGAGGKIVQMTESATEDSEEASELEERDKMEKEILEALESLKSSVDSRFEAMEKAIAEIPAKAEESEKEDEKVEESALDIAEALASSELDADGRARVLDLHRSTKKPLAELIESEVAYLKKHVDAANEVLGAEESKKDEEELEESAVPTLKRWKKVNN